MKISHRRFEELLWAIGFHGLYLSIRRLTRRGRHTESVLKSLKAFYRPLLPPGALVFDIGANIGTYSLAFSSLGARVVALEPNPDCVRHMLLSYGPARIETLQAAAGDRNGLATISLSEEVDPISSMSDDWIESIQRVHPDYAGQWSQKVPVPMVTLDSVIQHFGVPYFIKIDVEGFEENVLDGLSTQPRLLSFEFNTAFLEATFRCLDNKLFSDASRFNFAFGDPDAFVLPQWVGRDELKRTLSSKAQAAAEAELQGDIFVDSSEEIVGDLGLG